jgi:type IV pilus assembly protein PilM
MAAARVVTNGVPRLVQVAEAPLASGIVSGGEVRNVEALALALEKFFKEHGLPEKAVRVGVASNRVGVRTIELAGISDPRQLANAVRFRAQEALPIPINEAVLDYQILSESLDEEGAIVRRVLFAVAYRDLIEGFAQACRQAGIRLVGVDLEAFALLRALTPFSGIDPDAPPSGLVAVSIGMERSTLGVSDGFSCEFTRVIDWGGGEVTAAIARELELELDEAERVKRSLRLDDETSASLSADQAAKAREAVMMALRSFARELVSSLQFYQSQTGSLDVREIVLAGGTARLAGLAEAVEQMVSVRVRVGDPTINVAFGKKLREGEPDPSLAVPIGLGMGL